MSESKKKSLVSDFHFRKALTHWILYFLKILPSNWRHGKGCFESKRSSGSRGSCSCSIWNAKYIWSCRVVGRFGVCWWWIQFSQNMVLNKNYDLIFWFLIFLCSIRKDEPIAQSAIFHYIMCRLPRCFRRVLAFLMSCQCLPIPAFYSSRVAAFFRGSSL